jgi:SNF2 family DNA or RNA helicase
MGMTKEEIEAEIARLTALKEQVESESESESVAIEVIAPPKLELDFTIADGGNAFLVTAPNEPSKIVLGKLAAEVPQSEWQYYTHNWKFPMRFGKKILDSCDAQGVEVLNRKLFENSLGGFLATPDIAFGFIAPNFTIKPRDSHTFGMLVPYQTRDAGRHDYHKKLYTYPRHHAEDLVKTIDHVKRVAAEEGFTVLVSPTCESELKQVISQQTALNIVAQQEYVPEGTYTFADDRELMKFQTVSQKFSELTSHRFILADEMGLGKTLQAIGIAMRNNFRTLCIVPANVLPNWHRELLKATGKEPNTLRGTNPSPMDIMELVVSKTHQFNIIGWSSLSNTQEITHTDGTKSNINEWINYINLSEFDFVVIDEAHRMKNESAQRSRAMLQLKCPRIMGMSGTPIENRPGEYYNILSLLYPEIFNNRSDFIYRYTDGKNGARNVQQLQALLRPIMLRRRKKDVLKDLPPVIRMQDFTQLSAGAIKVYNKLVAGILEMVDSNGNVVRSKQLQILEMLLRLKQFTSSFKANRAIELAQEAYEDNSTDHRKVIIFSQFRPIASRIARKLGKEAVHFDGTIDVYERQAIVDRFQNDPSVKYLVCTTKAAQEGLNITAAGTVIFVDLMWTPSAHQQAEARAYGRLSDAHGIEAHYLLCEGTFDEEIWKLLEKKLQTIEEVVDGVTASRYEEDVNIASSIVRSLFTRRLR